MYIIKSYVLHIHAITSLYNTVTAPVADGAMLLAAINGHLEIVKLCKEWGATEL